MIGLFLVLLAQATVEGKSPSPIRVTPSLPPYQCTSTGCAARPMASKEGDWVSVSDFTGASVGAQIDAACTSLAGQQGMILIPRGVGSGDTLVGLPDNCRLLDLRATGAPDPWNRTPSNFARDILLRGRWTADPANPLVSNIQTLHVFAEPDAGGISSGPGQKTNWAAIFAVEVASTPGQHETIASWANNFSNGDTTPFFGYAQTWGGNATGGDEGVEGISVISYQGDVVMTGTVSSVAGTTINYSTVSNEYTRGEGRPLIITTPAKVYSTGTISSISGTPPTVTGSGTAWATQFGAGAKTNLFFALDSEISGGLKLVVPIRSITDETHLVLNYQSNATDTAITGTSTGTYKIYKGGMVQTVSQLGGSVTVSPASDFAATDTFEEPLGYNYHMIGGNFAVSPTLSETLASRTFGLNMANVGLKPMLAAFHSTGSTIRGLAFDNTWATDGIGSSKIGLSFLNSPDWLIYNFDTAVDTHIYSQASAGSLIDTFTHSPAANLFGFGTSASNYRFAINATTGVVTFDGGVYVDGKGFKHKRDTAGCATAASVGATCTTTITWATAFVDANYTPVCVGLLITSGVPVNGGFTAKAAASVTFQTVAMTAAAAQYTTISCHAVHD